MMGEMTRAFLALELPAAAHESAAAAIERLRAQVGTRDVKWVTPENLHITLRFFGSLDPEHIVRAQAEVQKLNGQFAAIASGWSELGAFPNPRRPQVIWFGLADEAGALKALAGEVNHRLVQAGFGRADKPFRAHVTAGRVRRGRRITWPTTSDCLTIAAPGFSIQQVALMESTLTPQGPVYTPLETARARP